MKRKITQYRPVIRPNSSIEEPSRRTPVWAEVDLCIIGGGAAGVAAAVGAARSGCKKILLIERYGFCGGAAVAGLSNTICGLFASGTGKADFITTGFSREFHDELKKRNGITDPHPFGKTFLSVHDPLVWKEISDDYLQSLGVQLLYHTLLVDVVRQGERIAQVLLENKSGRGAISARNFIDASGDAELVSRAGGAMQTSQKGRTQAPTMMFRMMNVDVSLAMKAGPELLHEKLCEAKKTGRYDLPRVHCYLFPSPRENEYSCNMTRLNPPVGCDKAALSGIDADDLTFCEIEGRRLVREYERFLQDYMPGFKRSIVNDTGTQVGIRQTRSILGKKTLLNQEVLEAKKFGSEAVTRSSWPIEDHASEEVKIVYLENDFYEVPIQALIPEALNNVLVAGRCLSAEHEALASARVTAQCLDMGYCAGQAIANR